MLYWGGEFESAEPFPWTGNYTANVLWDKSTPDILIAELRQDGALRWYYGEPIEDPLTQWRGLRRKAIEAAQRRGAKLVKEKACVK